MPPSNTSKSLHGNTTFLTLVPALFVVLWATGYIGARLGAPYAEPYTFLSYRFSIAFVLMLAFAYFTRAKWPETFRQAGHSFIAGVLIHGIYLGGVFHAIDLGMPTGLSAIIIGLQPILTAIASAPLFGERVTQKQWLGIGFGFIGLIIIVNAKTVSVDPQARSQELLQYGLCILALIAITVGSFYQKAYCATTDLRTGNVFQLLGATTYVLIMASIFEDGRIEWTGEFIFALGWLILVMSLGAFSMLMIMIRLGAITKVTSLLFLVPPITAVMGYVLFDELMTNFQIFGMALAVVGVGLASGNLLKKS